jgi:hypothetical protein
MLSVSKSAPRSYGIPATASVPVATFKRDGLSHLQSHPGYAATKAGDHVAAASIVRDLVTPANLDAAKQRFGADAIYRL